MSEHTAYVNYKSLMAIVLVALLTVALLTYSSSFSNPLSRSPQSPNSNGFSVASVSYYYDPHIPQEDQRVVCIVFDDGWISQYTTALPILNQYDFKATFAVVPSYIENYPGYMSISQVMTLHNQGHDIASHSADHHNLAAQSTNINHQLLQSKQNLLSYGINAPIFVYPFGGGAGNPDIEQRVQQHYCVARGIKQSSLDMNQPFSPYALPAYGITNSTTMEMFKSYADQAKGSNIVIIYYHLIGDGSVDTSVTISDFATHMQYLYDNHFTVQTLKQLFTSIESSVEESVHV
jgi:hypothetical protein